MAIDPNTITVPAFTPALIAPKPKPVSAKTCSGAWPASPETLAAIESDIETAEPGGDKHVQAHILIAACIDCGIDAGFAIRAVGIELGFDPRQIGILLRADNTPWQKGPEGRYHMI